MGMSPIDFTSCFTSSPYGILSGSNEDFGNDFGHPVTAGDMYDGTSTLHHPRHLGDCAPLVLSSPCARRIGLGRARIVNPDKGLDLAELEDWP